MKMKVSAITAAGMLLALAAQTASAAEAVGYNVVTVPANSDAVVSVPFSQNVQGTFTVASVSGTGVTVNEALSADTYDSSYYIRVIDGAGEGLWSTITANGSGGLTLTDDFSGYVAIGDTFRVYEHHTIGSVFPGSLKGVTFETSTQILVPNTVSVGVNKSASPYAYKENGFPPFDSRPGWYQGITYKSDLVFAPDSYVLVRNNGASNLSIVVFGDVPDMNIAQVLSATSGANDLYLSGFPVDTTFGDFNLGGLGQLLVVDNSASGINKSPAPFAWKPAGFPPFDSRVGWYQGITYMNDTVVPAGTGVILRRDSGATETKWTLNKQY